MEYIKETVSLLARKRELFCEFERKTEEMLSCSAEELEGLLREREGLIKEIDEVNSRVSSLVGDPEGPEGARMLDALGNRGDRGDLPEALWPVYDGAAAVRSVVVRLTETETQAAMRLGVELQHTLETIKSTNRGVGAQAARFISAAGLQSPPSFHIGEA